MISIEIDFIYFFASLLFLQYSLLSITKNENKNLFLVYWLSLSVIGILFLISLSKWEFSVFGWDTQSIFFLLTKTNLILFFAFQVLGERIFSYSRIAGFFILVLLTLFFGSFFYWIHLFQSQLLAQDESRLLPFTIAMGAFVWTREMFWNPQNLNESKLVEEDKQNLLFLFLPCILFLLSPYKSNYEFIEMIGKPVVLGFSSLIGFSLISQYLKVSIPREAEIGVWLGSIGFSTAMSVELVVSIPLAFVIGMFGRGIYFYLDELKWSDSGKWGVVSYLLPSVIATFLPFLVIEPKDWNHAPYVLLGVQVLYFLSFYLISSLVFGFLLLIKPKSE
ncbi:hypothetical protein [Leptospira levettii]|uniref:hypothetical protein n=1 Tax=Leptospira levettii TaxID=2023178 RepID=UPI0010843AA9|nr:hypothetical protein [Leptospira levettii]TGK98150.1 hypothetical protein EHQ34_07565 [Leptospira levettii]TGL14557.1 hypothetical protein EHQ39_00970 [Leptospira levettii]